MRRFCAFFIDRPIFAGVVSILLVLAGLLAIPSLPIAQYPELALPQVTVTATWLGASAETVERAVTTPLEQEINGVQGALYI
ncbi:MAG: efflux RND transporter permease subunit, partial [Myxococcales bacterium]